MFIEISALNISVCSIQYMLHRRIISSGCPVPVIYQSCVYLGATLATKCSHHSSRSYKNTDIWGASDHGY